MKILKVLNSERVLNDFGQPNLAKFESKFEI